MPLSYANQPTTLLPSISHFIQTEKKSAATQTVILFTTEKVFKNLFM